MLFAQAILFVVVAVVSYAIMNQYIRTWVWAHAWYLFLSFGLPPLIALIQRKALFSFWLSDGKGARHPRMLALADLITCCTSITQGLFYGVMRLLSIVAIAVFLLFRVDTSLLKGNRFFVGFDMPYQSYLSVLSHIRQKGEYEKQVYGGRVPGGWKDVAASRANGSNPPPGAEYASGSAPPGDVEGMEDLSFLDKSRTAPLKIGRIDDADHPGRGEMSQLKYRFGEASPLLRGRDH